MNYRFCLSMSLCAVFALSMAGGAVAGSGSYPGISRASARGGIVIDSNDGSTVQLHFKGADRIHIDLSGALEIVNSDGHVWHYRPDVYQVAGGRQKSVSVRIESIDKDRVVLQIGKRDASARIVVNPVGRPL